MLNNGVPKPSISDMRNRLSHYDDKEWHVHFETCAAFHGDSIIYTRSNVVSAYRKNIPIDGVLGFVAWAMPAARVEKRFKI